MLLGILAVIPIISFFLFLHLKSWGITHLKCDDVGGVNVHHNGLVADAVTVGAVKHPQFGSPINLCSRLAEVDNLEGNSFPQDDYFSLKSYSYLGVKCIPLSFHNLAKLTQIRLWLS